MFKLIKLFPSLKTKSKYLVLFSVGVSILELFSVALIIPLLTLLLDTSYKESSFFGISNLFFDNRNLGFIYLSVLVVFFFIIKNICSYLLKKYIYKYCFDEQKKLRLKIFDFYLYSPYEKIISSDYSKKFSILTELTRVSTESFLIYLIEFFSNIIISLAIFSFLVYYNPQFTLFLTAIFLISAIFLKKTVFKKIYHLGKKNTLAFKNIVKFTETAINAIKELKVYLKESLLRTDMENSSKDFSNSQVNFLLIQNLPKYLIEIIIISGILLLCGYILIVESEINKVLITIGVYVFISLRLAPLMNQILSCYANITRSKYSIETLLEEIDFYQSSNNRINYSSNSYAVFSQSLELDKLNFRYGEKIIFEDTSFKINHGETILIHGDSGSGKTTLVYLLLGFLKINSSIMIDGKTDHADYLNIIDKISYIPQEPYMLNDTIRNNILFGSKYDQDLEKITLIDSNLSSLIKDFKDGIKTIVGDKGNKISGGQKQRISIARALYNNKNFIILDEPSTFLDNKSKLVLLDTLKKLKGKYTVIIISHENIFDDFSNRIYYIKNKKLVEKKN